MGPRLQCAGGLNYEPSCSASAAPGIQQQSVCWRAALGVFGCGNVAVPPWDAGALRWWEYAWECVRGTALTLCVAETTPGQIGGLRSITV